MGHLYILATILFTVYGQLIIKWQMNQVGHLPDSPAQKIVFLLRLLTNPWILSGFLSAFLAALAWMAAMTKFDLSYAYPFMSLAFVLVLLCSGMFFNESVSAGKIAGLALIAAGIVISSQG